MEENTSFGSDNYQKSLSSVTFFHHVTTGFLTISVADSREFLQPQTTNDFNQLKPDRPLVTVLTSPSARILDVLTIIEEGEHLLAITMPGQGSETLTFLRRRIFFNDRVSVDNQSEKMALIDFLGPDSSELLHRLGVGEAPERGYIQNTKVAGSSCRVYSHRELDLQLLIPAESKQDVIAELTVLGAASLSPYEFEILRIESGLPAAGHELTMSKIP